MTWESRMLFTVLQFVTKIEWNCLHTIIGCYGIVSLIRFTESKFFKMDTKSTVLVNLNAFSVYL